MSPISFLAFGNAVKGGVEFRRMPLIAAEPFTIGAACAIRTLLLFPAVCALSLQLITIERGLNLR